VNKCIYSEILALNLTTFIVTSVNSLQSFPTPVWKDTFYVLLMANKNFTADTARYSTQHTAHSIGRNCVHSEVIRPIVLQYILNIILKLRDYL